MDATAPASIRLLKHLKITSAAGSAAAGRYLYVLSHEGKLHTVDVATPASARIVHTLSGLGSPWELVVVGKRAYVADNRDGVVVVDLSTPSAPKLAARVAAAGGLQDIVHAGGKLYAAAGSAGVEVFDLADPAKPVSRGATPVGDAVISVSAAGGLLWVTDQARAGVLDISGARPRPLAFEATPSWAMHVHATGGTAYVADWNALAVLTFDPTKRAPQADLVPGEVYLDAATRTRTITLHNRGGATLDIATVAIDDPRLSVTVGRRALAPGEKATLTLTFKNDGKAVSARLCVATNDPDQPVQRIPFATTNTGSRLKVGDVAPNFQLPDLAGVRRELKAQLGSPVLLAYFATW